MQPLFHFARIVVSLQVLFILPTIKISVKFLKQILFSNYVWLSKQQKFDCYKAPSFNMELIYGFS